MLGGCHVKPEQFFNLIFGYYDRYLETVVDTSVNGTTTVSGSKVPTGEVWVVTHISIWHNDPLARVLRISLFSEGTAHRLVDVMQIAQGYLLERQGWWVLKAGDRLQGTAEDLAAGRTVRLCGNGFKMKVTQ